jgi:hypothetical protein
VAVRDIREQIRVCRLPSQELDRWLSEKKPQDFAAHIRAALEALKALTAEGKPQARSARSRA